MTAMQTVDPATPDVRVPERRVHAAIADDKAMLRAGAELTRDIGQARPGIYWPDMLGSAGVGYAALAGAILVRETWAALACGVVAVLALYRALLFIHEISHLHRNALPGFRTAWNMLVGIPLLTPSFMYEGVHTLHHARTRYGTVDDPEYLPLALMKPWSLPAFVLIALLAPIGLVIRYAVLAPLGAIVPAIRRMNWERFSALAINPGFRRRPPDAEAKRRFFWLEVGASAWAVVLVASVFFIGWRPLLIALAIFSLVALFNQLRTLVAHLWENEGEPMTDDYRPLPRPVLKALEALPDDEVEPEFRLRPGMLCSGTGKAPVRIKGLLCCPGCGEPLPGQEKLAPRKADPTRR